jgi:imidazolonepropionase-like amidohydrolase
MNGYDLTRCRRKTTCCSPSERADDLDCGYTSAFSAAAPERASTSCSSARSRPAACRARLLANGPEITVSGGLGDTNVLHLPHYETPTFAWVADGPDAIRRVCRILAREGVDLLKLNLSGDLGTSSYPSDQTPMTGGEVAAAMEVARAAKLRVAAHCRSAESVMLALHHGVEVIYHANYADERALDALRRARPRVRRSRAGPHLQPSQAGGPLGIPPARLASSSASSRCPSRRSPVYASAASVLPGGDYGFPATPHGTYARDRGSS